MALVPQAAPAEYSQASEGQFRADLARQVETLVRNSIPSEAEASNICVHDSFQGDAVQTTTIEFDATFSVDERLEPDDHNVAVISYGPASTRTGVSGDFELSADIGPSHIVVLSGDATLTRVRNLTAPLQVIVERNGHTLDIAEGIIVPAGLDLRDESQLIVLSIHRFASNMVVAAGFNADPTGTLGTPTRDRVFGDAFAMAATRGGEAGAPEPVTAPVRPSGIILGESWAEPVVGEATFQRPFGDSVNILASRSGILATPPALNADNRGMAVSMAESYLQQDLTIRTKLFTPNTLSFDTFAFTTNNLLPAVLWQEPTIPVYLRAIRINKQSTGGFQMTVRTSTSATGGSFGTGAPLSNAWEGYASAVTMTYQNSHKVFAGPTNSSFWTTTDNGIPPYVSSRSSDTNGIEAYITAAELGYSFFSPGSTFIKFRLTGPS